MKLSEDCAMLKKVSKSDEYLGMVLKVIDLINVLTVDFTQEV